MRNAATFDDDIGFQAPARRTPPRKPGKKKRKKSKRFSIDMQKVARYAAIGMSASVAFGIMVNALLMQKGHHPAPLFGQSIKLADPVPVPRPDSGADTATAAPAANVADAADPAPDAAPVPVPPRRLAAADTTAKSNGDDPIARLLKGSGDAAATEKSDPIRVLGVQQALAKLHFTLKPNGTFGPATKKAIEAFEKDRHLPVNGEITRRLVKILSAESGLKID